MANEIYNQADGALRWVQASATGDNPYTAWKTGSAPPSGVLGYVQSLSYTSGEALTTIKDRGQLMHHKRSSRNEIQVTFQTLWTGAKPNLSAYNASVAMMNLEYEQDTSIIGQSANYVQFHGVAIESLQFSEAENGNTMQYTCRALGMNGPTASGYIA